MQHEITEDVRKFAAEQKLSEEDALRAGMEHKVKEFIAKGFRSLREWVAHASRVPVAVSRRDVVLKLF